MTHQDLSRSIQLIARQMTAERAIPQHLGVGATRNLRRLSYGADGGMEAIIDDITGTMASTAREEEAADFLPSIFLALGAERARSVCLVNASGVDYLGRKGAWGGTGFLVSESILLTNHHVFNSRAVCRAGSVTFDYEINSEGRMREPNAFRLDPDRLFLTSKAIGGLDFTFVWVEGTPGRAYGWFEMDRRSMSVELNERANIIQHPKGRPKEVVIQNNTITHQDLATILYTSDTQSGSSGSAVCNNQWKLVGLHHAWDDDETDDQGRNIVRNEAIKLSAIAAHLEQVKPNSTDRAAADEVLRAFRGRDGQMGFFGNLGRENRGNSALESLVSAYRGEAEDIDVGFWNIEWFNNNFRRKLPEVARIIAETNLDVWGLSEVSPQSTRALVQYLNRYYGLEYDYRASEPHSNGSYFSTTVIFNTKAVSVERVLWPERIHRWFKVKSRDFHDLGFEAIHGKVFNRYPGLFKVTTKTRQSELGLSEEDFFVVPVHLKAKSEGRMRRRMASRLLTEAIKELSPQDGWDKDWIIGGDFNGELADGDFDSLIEAGMQPLSAADASDHQITYIKRPFKSLIDHIFLSPNLMRAANEDDFAIIALDRDMDDFLSISDHRPVLVRLSFGQSAPTPAPVPVSEPGNPLASDDLRRVLRDISSAPTEPEGTIMVKGRVYYDPNEDARLKRSYYADMPTDNPSALFEFLVQLLSRTHKRTMGYKPKRHLYPWVDLRPNGNIRSVYSGTERSVESWIALDEAVDRRRKELMAFYETHGFEFTGAQNLEEALESSSGRYNCEHVVPQSWFGRQQPMRGDLHHLFACQVQCNTHRDNEPYADLPGRPQNNCGHNNGQGFEPAEGRGAVARATLCFLLRYPGEIRNTRRQYTPQSLATLLDWHNAEAPSLWEKHRNAAIQNSQGNRNPLIDHPELTHMIPFERCLG